MSFIGLVRCLMVLKIWGRSHLTVRDSGIAECKLAGHSLEDVGSSYGGAKVEPWSKDFRIGVLSMMGKLLECLRFIQKEKEMEYWVEKLAFDKRRFSC